MPPAVRTAIAALQQQNRAPTGRTIDSVSSSATSLALTPQLPTAQPPNGNDTDRISVEAQKEQDDIAFLELKLCANLSGSARPPPSISASPTFDSSQLEQVVFDDGCSEPATSTPRSSSYKYFGQASTLRNLRVLQSLSSRSLCELGFYPQRARRRFWTAPTGFHTTPRPQSASLSTIWPAPDLADKLMDAYFGRINRDFPCINEAQFRHDFANLSQRRDADPSCLALACSVFMVGSLYVLDDRVCAPRRVMRILLACIVASCKRSHPPQQQRGKSADPRAMPPSLDPLSTWSPRGLLLVLVSSRQCNPYLA